MAVAGACCLAVWQGGDRGSEAGGARGRSLSGGGWRLRRRLWGGRQGGRHQRTGVLGGEVRVGWRYGLGKAVVLSIERGLRWGCWGTGGCAVGAGTWSVDSGAGGV